LERIAGDPGSPRTGAAKDYLRRINQAREDINAVNADLRALRQSRFEGAAGKAAESGAKAGGTPAETESAGAKVEGREGTSLAEGAAAKIEGEGGKLGGAAAKIESAGLTKFESVTLKIGSLLEAALPGPQDVLFLWIGFFGSIAEAKAKLREEAYNLGFSEGMAANLMGFDAGWVSNRLNTPAPRDPLEAEGFKAARAGGNNQGVVDGYRFVRCLTYDQRGAFLKQGFTDIAKQGAASVSNSAAMT
jgi:hypothetical protein